MQKIAVLMLALGMLSTGLCEAGRHHRRSMQCCPPGACCTPVPQPTCRATLRTKTENKSGSTPIGTASAHAIDENGVPSIASPPDENGLFKLTPIVPRTEITIDENDISADPSYSPTPQARKFAEDYKRLKAENDERRKAREARNLDQPTEVKHALPSEEAESRDSM